MDKICKEKKYATTLQKEEAEETIIELKILKGEFNFDSKHWENISEEAKSLIRKMLTYDYKTRPSAEELLNDTWFKVNEILKDN